MTNVTYQVVLQVLEAFSAQHLQIKRFHSDFPDNIPDFSNDKEDFPILFVSPTNSIFQQNTNIFNIRVYCFDLITEGRENINTILSDTHSILSDLGVYLRDGNIPAIDLLQSSNLTPLNNQLLDYAAGWYVDIQLEVSTSDLCSIPFSSPPVIGSSICNSITFIKAVPESRRLTINNVTYDLSEDRTWVIFSGTSTQFVKGNGSLDSTIYEPTANKQNNLSIDGTGVKFPTVDAVNFVTNEMAKATLNTGFLDTSDVFTLYVANNFTLGISGSTKGIIFKPLLETPPFGVQNAIVNLTSRTIPLSGIGLTINGNYIKFVGYRQSDDSILFSDNQFHQTPTVCQLGLVLVKFTGGTTSFIDLTRNFVNKPDIAAYSNLETTAISLDSSVTIAPATTNDLHIQNNAGSLIGVSVNWQGNNNDLLSISANTATTFTYLVPLSANTFPIVTTDLIDPTQFFSGTTLVPLSADTNASIQRFLITVKGTIVVQYGERQYTTLDDAKNAIFVDNFTEILPTGSAIEIGRVALIKSATTLADETQAFFVTNNGGGGGGATSTTVSWGDITGDITNQTDLVQYIDANIFEATTGTTNFIVKFDSTGLTNSSIFDNGSIVNINIPLSAHSFIKSGGTANQFLKADGSIDSNVYLTGFTETDTLQSVTNRGSATTHSILANGFIKSGGTSNQFLKADGSIDSNVYLTAFTETDTLQSVTDRGSATTQSILANAFIKSGGTFNQFLKADGNVDSTVYLSAITLTGDVTGTTTGDTIFTTLKNTGTASTYTTVITDAQGRVTSGFNDTTIYEPTANKQNSMVVDGFGIKFPTVDAVNTLVNNVARATLNTGFLTTDDAFTLYVFDDFTLGISGSSVGILFEDLLETPPFAPSAAIKQLTSRTVPLSGIGLTGTGNFIKFVGYRESDDSVIFSDTTFHQTPTVCQLGLVLVKYSAGTTSFIDPTRTFVNKPDIAGYSNLETTAISLKSSVTVAPANSNDLKIQNSSGNLMGISVNWQGNNNDLLPISAFTSTTFTYVAPLEPNTFPISGTTFIDPTKFFSGNTLVNLSLSADSTIQRVLLTVKGTIVVQYGEQYYNSFTEAKNNVFISLFTDILPPESAIEIGRIVTTSGTTNLADDTQAFFYVSGQGGGGTSSSPTVTWGDITGDITNQTDLVNYINEATTGTTNFITKFDSTGLTDSSIFDNGLLVTINNPLSAHSFIKSGGTSNQFLMADGSVTTGSVTFTGTTNFVQKLNATSALTNSLIQDNGIGLGIATTAHTTTATTINIGNQTNRKITIEPTLSGAGKNLIISASDTLDTSSSGTPVNSEIFTTIDTTSGQNRGIAIAPNGDVYSSQAGGDILKQTGGVGAFVALGQVARNWYGMAAHQNGNIYCCVYDEDIFMQTGGVGNFVSLGQGNQGFIYCTVDSLGDVYATTNGGDIWKQTGGVGNFVALGQANRVWRGITEMGNDLYACVETDGIYKQTNKTGAFVQVHNVVRYWEDITSVDNVLYAIGNDDLYKSIDSGVTFNAMSAGFPNSSFGISSRNAVIYANGVSFISKSPATGGANVNGGLLTLKAGLGIGQGSSRVQILTGIKNGGTPQNEAVRIEVNEDGNSTFFGNIIKDGGTSNQFLMADGSVTSGRTAEFNSESSVYAIQSQDANKTIYFTADGGNINVDFNMTPPTIPTIFEFVQYGTSTLQFIATSVIFKAVDNIFTTNKQYQKVTLSRIDNITYLLTIT